jgi:glycosyltransferase involved in cell wall biosynthesis
MNSCGQSCKPVVLVVTHYASPYQLELFDEVAHQGRVTLKVYYVHTTSLGRYWDIGPVAHQAHFGDKQGTPSKVMEEVINADLVVFNTYNEKQVRLLFSARVRSQRPWCFWGERPGFRGLGWLGRAYRYWRLAALRRSIAPIWGIGQFAIQGYQQEFGTRRAYENIPYYSNLKRFRRAAPRAQVGIHKTVLYSGTLCHRKGVDLLGQAFTQVASHSNLRLVVLGDGPDRAYLEAALSPFKERVEFLGFQKWQALPEIYWKADVLCVPSRYDGWGLVVPEGLAAGLPVIASD